MPKDANQLVVYELAALQCRILETLNLLLDDDLEGCGTNEQRRCGTLPLQFSDGFREWLTCAYGRVVQDRSDIAILDLVERVDSLYTLAEKLMEDKADTSASGQLVQGEIVRVTVDRRPEVRAEVGDDRQDNARRALVSNSTAEGDELSIELLLLLCDARFDVWQSGANVVHEDLGSDL